MSTHYGRARTYAAPQGLWTARVTHVRERTAQVRFDDINPADEFVAVMTEQAQQTIDVGDHVLCAFLNGRVDQPVVLARIAHEPIHVPPPVVAPPPPWPPDLGAPVIVTS